MLIGLTISSVLAHSARTSTTQQLWKKRASLSLRDRILFQEEEIEQTQEPFIVNKKPSDSFVEVKLNFSTDTSLQEQYVNLFGGVRVGKILEDLDAMAGNIAHAHADDNNPKTRPLQIVTASVDRIMLLDKLHIDRDLVMKGQVSYCGKSSMDVRIEVESYDPNNGFYPIILAGFTMVALSSGKSAPVNTISPTNDYETLLYNMGHENYLKRKESSKNALTIVPPTSDEVKIVHDLYLQSKIDKNRIPTSHTKLQSVSVCQPQERNSAGKVFGGFLMQKAHELAWSCAQVFCGEKASFLALDHVSFDKPVEIGSILIFESCIVYNETHSLCIRVDAEDVNTTKNTRIRTNTFYFTFVCNSKELPKVVPQTYEEAVMYVEGKRRFEASRRYAEVMGCKFPKL